MGRVVATVALVLCAVIASATAQTVPVQPPAAKKDAAPTPPSGLQLTPTGAAAAAPQDATNSEARQRALVERINGYLTNMQTLVGDFVQVGPDGGRTQGTFYIQKPGKVRFEYNPPSPIDVVADGSSVVVRDRNLDTQQLWPLSETPLRYLLADKIDLMRDTKVVSVSADDKFITVVVEEKQVMVGTTRLMIMFDAKNATLKQWTVTDPQSLDTTVAVYNLDVTKKPDPNLFVINYQRNPGSFSNQ